MRVRCPSLILALTLTLTTALAPALAETRFSDLSKSERAVAQRFAANNSLFVLYHEVGHLLIDQLDLPVLGREEDAADNMATWTLLSKHTKEADQALEDSARGWLLSGVVYDSGGDESDYAASHSLDKQRSYQIVCLMVGSDDHAFDPIASQYALDVDRRDSCGAEYDLTKRSFEGLLSTRAIRNGPPTKVTVTYHTATGRLKPAAEAFKASGIFDQVAEELRSKYSLREPVKFNAKRCGEANAFFDPETTEIIFCYELMQDYLDLYLSDYTPPVDEPKTKTKGGGQSGTKDKG